MTLLCKDCVFAELRDQNDWRCMHSTSIYHFSPDLVTGAPTEESMNLFCKSVRRWSSTHMCGPEGRYWQPKIDAPSIADVFDNLG